MSCPFDPHDSIIPKILAGVILVTIVVAFIFSGIHKAEASTRSQEGSVVVETIVHDGHWFISAYRQFMEGGITFIHHPDCPKCRNK